jgi:hypothetical protein
MDRQSRVNLELLERVVIMSLGIVIAGTGMLQAIVEVKTLLVVPEGTAVTSETEDVVGFVIWWLNSGYMPANMTDNDSPGIMCSYVDVVG